MFKVCCLTHVRTCESTTLAIYLLEMILFDPRLPMFDDNYQLQCYIIVTNVNSIIVLVNVRKTRTDSVILLSPIIGIYVYIDRFITRIVSFQSQTSRIDYYV